MRMPNSIRGLPTIAVSVRGDGEAWRDGSRVQLREKFEGEGAAAVRMPVVGVQEQVVQFPADQGAGFGHPFGIGQAETDFGAGGGAGVVTLRDVAEQAASRNGRGDHHSINLPIRMHE